MVDINKMLKPKRKCKYCGKVHKYEPFTDCHNPKEETWDSLEDQYNSYGFE